METPRTARDKTEAEIQAFASLTCDVDLTSLRTSDGTKLTQNARRELLESVRAGGVVELVVEATVYRQSKTARPLPYDKRKEANANFSTFRPRDLSALAKSFRGRPILRDHERGDLRAVGGEILASQLEEDDSWFAFRQTMKLVKPWLVESALDGTLRTFSIAWDPKDRGLAGFRASAYCTICNAPLLSESCSHFPGDSVQLSEDEPAILAELEWRKVRGAETSAVSFPAVDGTAVDQIRAALAEHRDLTKNHREAEMAEEQKPDQASEVEKLKAELAASKEKLAMERAERAREAKERQLTEIAALRETAFGTGLFEPGSALCESFDALAELSIEKAQNFLDALQPRNPVGQGLTSNAAPAHPAPEASKLDRLCDEVYEMPGEVKQHMPKVLKQLGLTEEDFAKHGPHNQWEVN